MAPAGNNADLRNQFDSMESLETLDVEKGGQKEEGARWEVPRSNARTQEQLSVILLDQGMFTVYKRLFLVCLLLNLVLLLASIILHWPLTKRAALLFCARNVLALTLCRSEAFLRVVFYLAVKMLGWPWVPLRIKSWATSFLQSLGGIHSSCGISAVIWLVYATALDLQHRSERTPKELWSITLVALFLMLISCVAAIPVVRHLHHNLFEGTHRLMGWTALALYWTLILLNTAYDPDTRSYDVLNFKRLVSREEVLLGVGITFFTILPWLTVRRVPVSVSSCSGHASLIKFGGGVKAGLLGRISQSPLSEWHAFAIISNGKNSHMMLAGAVGDFTKSLVSNPPTHLWVRTLHFAGLPYLIRLYNRIVLVATGSGIAVFLSFLLQTSRAQVYLIWVAKAMEKNFGKEITDMVRGHPSERVIVHDTAVDGRANIAQLTVEATKKWEAEAVVVTSNPLGTRDVVRACTAAGITAFGPIWDS